MVWERCCAYLVCNSWITKCVSLFLAHQAHAQDCGPGFKINSISSPAPGGWCRPGKAYVTSHLNPAKACCDSKGAWAILLIGEGAKISGSGYGYQIQDNEGGAGSELLMKGKKLLNYWTSTI